MTKARFAPLALSAISALAGCIYNFDNPVSLQDAGTITGALVPDGGVAGQIVGTRVDLLWSNLSIDLGASGQFTFLDLPDGTYTLRYTVPPATPGGVATVGELLDIYLPFTAASVSDTIALGAISVSLPGTVEGNVTADGGAVVGAVVGAFTQGGAPGVIEYEGYATTTDSTGHYSLLLPHGNHAIWASTATEAASLDIDALKPGEDRSGQDLSIALPTLPGSQLSGYVVVDPEGAHASESVVETLLSDPFTVTLSPSCSTCQTRLSFGTPAPAQGVSAAQVAVTGIPAGLSYGVTCALPATSPPIPSLSLSNIPIIAGQSTLLRQIFMLQQTTLATNGALPLDAGIEDGGEDAGPVVDAGVDAGPDGGADAGPDAGTDAGFDAGSDAGPDAGPDGGPADAGPAPMCTVPLDAGTALWSLVGSLADPGAPAGASADVVVSLPLPGGFQTLVISEDQISTMFVTDNRAGKFGTPAVIWEADAGPGSTIEGSLTGTTYRAGSQNFVAWATFSPAGDYPVVAAQQIDGGPWLLLQTGQVSSEFNGDEGNLAAVYDDTGTPWVVASTATSVSVLQFAPLGPGERLPVTEVDLAELGDGGEVLSGLAATSCTNPADGGAAICAVSYGYFVNGSYAAWLTTLDPASNPQSRAFNTAQIYSAVGGEVLTGVALSNLGCGFLEVAFVSDANQGEYRWATLQPGQQPTFDAGGPEPEGLPALFPWRGSAILVSNGNDGTAENVTSLGPWAAPALPSTAGITPNSAEGYVDPTGAVYLGLVYDVSSIMSDINLYRLNP